MSMVIRKKNRRNLLAYFLESKIWKQYENNVVLNYAYWQSMNKVRAQKMLVGKFRKNYGFIVEDYIYDMMQCVLDARLKKTTEEKLIEELDQLIDYHTEKGTLKYEVTYD